MNPLLFAVALAHEGFDDALVRADALVRLEPEVAAHRTLRADLLRRAGQAEQALDDVAVALRLGDASAWLVAAEVHVDRGDWAAAEDAAGRALPDDDAWALIATARDARGDVEGALDAWDAAIAAGPTADRVLVRGRLAEASGDLDRAARGYADAPDAVAARLALFDLERRRGRPEAARAQADALLAMVPDHPEWLLLRASVSDPPSARADLARALAVLDAQIATRPTEQRLALRAEILEASR